MLGKTRGAPGSLGETVSPDRRVKEVGNSRHAPDVCPLTGKIVGKGDGNRESGDVSCGGIDREAVWPTTFFGLVAAAAHIASRTVGVLDGASD